jgi:hypothetical protein
MRVKVWTIGAVLAGVFGGLFAVPAVAQPSEQEIRLQDVLPRYSEYLSLPVAERDSFTPVYRIRPPEGGQMPRFWLETARGRVDLPVAPEGIIDLARVTALMTENPPIKRDPPDVRVRLNMAVAPILPPGLSVTGDVLRDSVRDANRAIGRFAGLAALVAPRIKGFTIVMPSGAAAPQVRLNTGRTEAVPPVADEPGSYLLEGRMLNRAEALILPVAATRYDFEF